jgi:hypothetical protein
MFGALVRLVLYRFLGARVLLALAAFGWLRRMLGGRRGGPSASPVRSGQSPRVDRGAGAR